LGGVTVLLALAQFSPLSLGQWFLQEASSQSQPTEEEGKTATEAVANLRRPRIRSHHGPTANHWATARVATGAHQPSLIFNDLFQSGSALSRRNGLGGPLRC